MTFDLSLSTQIKLPVLVAKNFVAIPSAEIRSEFTRIQDLRSLKKAELYQNYCVLMSPVNDKIKADAIDGHYKRAVIAKVILNTAIANSVNRVKFEVIMRCNIIELDYAADCLMSSVETVPSSISSVDEANATIALIKKEMVVTKGSSPEEQLLSQKVALALNRNLPADILSDTIASIIVTKVDARLKYLFEEDATKRLFYVLTDLRANKFNSELERKIDEKIKEQITEDPGIPGSLA